MWEHGTKSIYPGVFHVDGDTSWSLLPSSASLLSNSTVQPVYLPKPVSTGITIKPDSILTNPIGKKGV